MAEQDIDKNGKLDNGALDNGSLDNGAREERLGQLLEGIGKRFSVDFRPLDYGGRVLQVLDVANMTEVLDRMLAQKAIKNPLRDLPLWAKIWPGSFVLETYLRKKVQCGGKSLLELGCGQGLLSLLASSLGFSSIVASDVEDEALLFAEANVLKNGLEDRIEVKKVDVTRPGTNPALKDPVDVIAASEILYLDELHGPLLNFVERHLAIGGEAVFCTDMARKKPHFAKKAAKRFEIQELFLPGTATDEEGNQQKHLYSLLVLRKKAAR